MSRTRRLLMLAAVLTVGLVATGCGGDTGPGADGDTKLKVAAVFSGSTTDADYNSLGLLALEQAKTKGVETAYSESVAVPDVERVMKEYLADGYNVIWTHGSQFYEATAKLERPRFLTQPPIAPWGDVDVFIAADRAAWEERPLHSLPPEARVAPGSADGQRSIELINQLASLRRPTRSPSQVVHGDLYGTVLFAGAAAPGITDITPYWRCRL